MRRADHGKVTRTPEKGLRNGTENPPNAPVGQKAYRKAPFGELTCVSGCYVAFINATAVSSIRFENPHSLSYQLETFTSRPTTLVSVASKIDERAS